VAAKNFHVKNGLSIGVTEVINSSGLIQSAALGSDFNEKVDDRVNALIQAGTGISTTYDDSAGTLTINGQVGDVTGVTAGDGLSGGGSSGDVSLAVDLNELTAATVDIANDSVAIIDASDNSSKKETLADIATAMAGTGITATNGVLSTTVGDITSVVAGDGLTGGGTSGDVTLAVQVDDSSIETDSDTLRVKASGITNAMLAGSIANAKLANSSITVSDGSNTTATALGGTITFAAGEGVDVAESSGTVTYSAELATETNAGVATFDGTDFTVSSGDVTMNAERIQDIAGAMFTGNTETGITATYQDADGTIDLTTSISGFDTDDLSEGSSNLYHTSERVDDRVNALLQAGTNMSLTYDDAANTLTIASSGKTEEEIEDIVGAQFATNGSHTNITATYDDAGDGAVDLAITDATIRGKVSVTDSGGDGSLAYNNSTGVITYTGPSASEVRAHISGGTGVTVSSGEIAIGQAVATSSNVTFADVAATGNLTVTGNLDVNGTTTTLDTTNSTITDRLIELGNGTTGTPANDMGIVLERGDSDNAFIGWDESADKFLIGTGSFTGASTGDLTVTTGTLVANLEGNVTGNITGNITGNVTGNVTGDLTGDVTGDVTGDLTGNVTGNVSGTAATVTGAAQTNITSLGTLTALTVDDISIDGSTITVADNSATALAIKEGSNDYLTFDTTNSAEKIVFNQTVDINGKELVLDADGDTSISGAIDDLLVFKSAGTSWLLASANVGFSPNAAVPLGNSSNPWTQLYVDNIEVDGNTIKSTDSDGDLIFKGNDGGSDVTALTLDMSEAGAATFNAGVTATTFTGALTGNVTGNVSGSSGSTTGNAATATALETARTINGVSFDGSANITTLTAGTGVSVAGTAVSIGQAVATTSNVTFNQIHTDYASNSGQVARNIYESTSAPSGGDGQVGDLWILYS